MSNIPLIKRSGICRLAVCSLSGFASAVSQAAITTNSDQNRMEAQSMVEVLSTRQQAIIPIAAFVATGDMPRLEKVLNQGLDNGQRARAAITATLGDG